MLRVLFARLSLTTALAPLMFGVLACRETETTAEPASTDASSARYGSVTFEARSIVGAETRSGPLAVRTSVVYTNTGRGPAEISISPGCLVSLRLRSANDGRIWDQVRWRARLAENSGFVLACTDTGARFILPPGGRRTLQTRDAPTVEEILGDSLRVGEYIVTATVFPPAGNTAAPPADLAAGRVQLPKQR